MDPRTEIEISRLLMQREALLVDIYEAEQQLQSLMHEDVAIPAPPPLPSLEKRKPRKVKRQAKRPSAPNKSQLPNLQPPGENAYCIQYTWAGQTVEEIHLDPRLIQQILDAGLKSVVIDRIRTGRLSALGAFAPLRDVTAEACPPLTR